MWSAVRQRKTVVRAGRAVGVEAEILRTAQRLALPARANVPIAVMMTLISNPLTFVGIVWAEHSLGRFVLRLDAAVPGQPVQQVADSGWLHWLMSSAGVAMVGALVLAPIVGAIGYAGAAAAWRWRIGRKWRRRHAIMTGC